MSSLLSIALVHHPVLDKNGERVTTSITNLDIHDIARTARTFGAANYYLVTPVESQIHLAHRIIGHWHGSWGRGYNPNRGEALSLVRHMPTMEALAKEAEKDGQPLLVATSARAISGLRAITPQEIAVEERHVVLVFGTGWGLHPDALRLCQAALPPIHGAGDYNHLPVRAAVAIYLDRITQTRNPQSDRAH